MAQPGLLFSEIAALLRSANISRAVTRDPNMVSPFFNTFSSSDGTVKQVWFDDATSLRAKYRVAARAGLRGVGPWTLDSVTQDLEESQGLWAAFDDFFAA